MWNPAEARCTLVGIDGSARVKHMLCYDVGSPAKAAASLLCSSCRTCSCVAWLPEAQARSAGEAPQDLAAVHAEAPSRHDSAHPPIHPVTIWYHSGVEFNHRGG